MCRLRSPRVLFACVACVACGWLTACVSTKTCEERAREAYQMCQHPAPAVSPGDDPPEPVVGEDAQSCNASYQHSLAQCSGGPEAPVPALGTNDAGAANE